MTASSPVKINRVPFKEWMTAILSVTKTDTLLQEMDGCNQSGDINRLPLKNLNAKDRSSKKLAARNNS